MGLVDGIYAIAMTLIAIELPELADSLLKADAKAFELGPLTAIFIYELTAYTTTFLILYELWTFHKAILFLAGLRKHTQNLINGLILAITCLGAGNVIVILKAKNETSTRALEQGATHSDLMKSWIGNSDQLVLVNVLIVAFSFLMMSELSIQRQLCNVERSAWAATKLFATRHRLSGFHSELAATTAGTSATSDSSCHCRGAVSGRDESSSVVVVLDHAAD